MLVISGRLRSTTTQLSQSHSPYRLQYQLSYDGGHCFSEKEKKEIAARMRRSCGDGKDDDDYGRNDRGRTDQREEKMDEMVVSVCL